jgi:cyclin H
MTYHPTDILKTALFFSTKTENHYFRLTKFAEAIGKTKAEDVLASEFLLTQGLRFTFDVRHPFRALEGAVMELQAMSTGEFPPLPGTHTVTNVPENMSKRVREAHGKAREYLKTSALLTDVYFHFSPSQIMFASLLIADPELTNWYILTKFPPSSNMCEKVMAALSNCANMLRTVPPTSAPSDIEMKELKVLAKKLQKCRNPEKMDLAALGKKATEKRDGEGELDEKTIKKRKLERERVEKEGNDLFGPSLVQK